MDRPLEGQVAVVAGATRGAGRGIACALGEAGATVYCTGRSVRGAPSPMGRPETIEETAERVTAAGGTGVWVRVDHTVEDEVEGLFRRVADERGRLDVLVNDVWGGDPWIEWGKPFWQLDPGTCRKLVDQAILSHVVTSRHGVPLMLDTAATTGRGLVVEVTDGDFQGYRGHLYYDLVKATVIRLAYAMACDLAAHERGRGVTALAVSPGFLRSEMMLDHFGVTEETWRDAIAKDPHYAESETPLFVGRAVAALAADPEVGARAGRVWASWTLAREYGFTDADGRRPDWGAYMDRTVAGILDRGRIESADEAFLLTYRRYAAELDSERAAEVPRILALLADHRAR